MMTLPRFLRVASPSLFIVLGFACAVVGQTEIASVSGLVTDRTGATVSGAEVRLQSVERGTVTTAATNDAGIYVFPSVHPGQYQISIQKQGFKQVDLLGLVVNVQDHIEQNFRLEVGSVAESVTVNANDLHIDTTDATVSTVVDRQFAENLPLNGRSFQTLIYLTPGVVATSASAGALGQFSVNGQRADTNYFMVDGVSANFGTSTAAGSLAQSAAGAVPGFTAQGGTNGLVSVEAMQEFRIETSTYAAEFGRTPGAQISIVTRSGTNGFHGALFEYLRNDVLDANDWFVNQNGLRKAEERQNDFGGVFGGPIIKNKTFFFFSYEGLRLRLPQTGITTVPSIASRQAASPSIQSFLNAFPIPNGPDLGNGQAPFNATFSNQSSLDSYGIRIDQSLGGKVNLFGRYSYAPSQLIQRGNGTSLNNIGFRQVNTHSLTLGTTWRITASVIDDFRFNYGRSSASQQLRLDAFGGATVPSDSDIFITPFTSQDSLYTFQLFVGKQLSWSLGDSVKNNLQRQWNILDSVSIPKGHHQIKFGVDYRRLSPDFSPRVYSPSTFFSSVSSVVAGKTAFTTLGASRGGSIAFQNFSAFAQDTWQALPRLSVSYGLRWELNPPPSGSQPLFAATGIQDLSTLNAAPPGTPLWKTTYGNFAPRVGIAYQLFQNKEWQSVVRGGFGVFYDLSTQQVGDAFLISTPPFGVSKNVGSTSFPLTPATGQAPSIPSAPPFFDLLGFDPNLKLPYTLQWNAAIEQGLGTQQTISVSGIGARGRRLLQQEFPLFPNANFTQAQLYLNVGSSNYDALQLQFRRHMSHGLQALASYTWSHSIDTASSGSSGSQPPSPSVQSDLFVRALGADANRGPSDFDIRHSISGALTYDIPSPVKRGFGEQILRGWSAQSIILARSAPPLEVFNSSIFLLFGEFADVRPDVVPGAPLYLRGQYPGGKALNSAAFTNPPLGSPDPKFFNLRLPTRQGNLGRNALRGFGAWQWDFGVHRDFAIHESLKLQFRAEFFNLLNHPNFALPNGNMGTPSLFGKSTQMLGRSLGQGGFGLNPLYEIGGPRSIQFALKLTF